MARLGLRALGLLLLGAAPAWPQGYEIAWRTVAAGGSMGSAGGPSTLDGTAAQPAAGGALSAGPYDLHSGFWAFVARSSGAEADLSISKSDGLATAIPGAPLVYTIVVGNAGPAPASGATVADALPESLLGASWTCIASSGALCSPSGTGGISDTVSLPPGGTLTYTLAATVDPAAIGSLGNTATVAAPTGVVDPHPGDNAATDVDLLTPLADLGVALSATPDPLGPYGTVTWTVTIANAGPSNAAGVTLVDTLPAQVSFVSATPGAPTCTQAGGVVACQAGALGAGQQTSIEIMATARPGFVGTLVDTAVVSGAEGDPNSANDSASATTQVVFLKGDLNLDVRTDLLLRSNTTGQNDVWLMNGTLRQGPPVTVEPAPPSLAWQIFGVDDFDGDRRNDLVWRDTTTGAVEFWLMNGTARVGAPVPIAGAPTLPLNWKLSATADFDHDGRPDLVWRNATSQKVVIWTMNGTAKAGRLVPTPDQAAHANWEIVGAQDCNGDGHTDLVWYNATSGKIVLWFMDQDVVRITGRFTTPPNAGDNNWNVLALGDYGPGPNGPAGSRDLVWRNATSGRFVVWFMDQAGNRTAGLFTTPMEPSPDPTSWTIVGPR